MTARKRPSHPRKPPEPSKVVDFRDLHRMHMEATARHNALKDEARELKAAGKIRAAKAKEAEARRIQDALTIFEQDVRSVGAYARKDPD